MPENFDNETWGPVPELTLSSPGVTLQSTGGEQTIEISSNYDSYTATVDEASRSWCSVEEKGNTLLIHIAENTQLRERTAVVSVSVGKGEQQLSKEVVITQLGASPKITTELPVVSFNQKGGIQRVKVITNQESWAAAVSVGNEWCSIERDGDELIIEVSEHEFADQREGVITVSGMSGIQSETVTTIQVLQMGATPVLNVSSLSAFDQLRPVVPVVLYTYIPTHNIKNLFND